jgi:hypothetical protein
VLKQNIMVGTMWKAVLLIAMVEGGKEKRVRVPISLSSTYLQ